MNKRQAAKLVLKAAARRGISAKGSVANLIPQVMALRAEVMKLGERADANQLVAPAEIAPLVTQAKGLLNNPAIFSQPGTIGSDPRVIAEQINNIVKALREAYIDASRGDAKNLRYDFRDARDAATYLARDIQRFASNRARIVPL